MFRPSPTAGYQPDISAFCTLDIMSCHLLFQSQRPPCFAVRLKKFRPFSDCKCSRVEAWLLVLGWERTQTFGWLQVWLSLVAADPPWQRGGTPPGSEPGTNVWAVREATSRATRRFATRRTPHRTRRRARGLCQSPACGTRSEFLPTKHDNV